MNAMDTKLFVFSRKEVALIFFIVLSLTLTSFALGVKFGKRYYLQLAGVQEADVQKVELESIEEERVNKLMQDSGSELKEKGATSNDLMHEQLKQKIIDELNEDSGVGSRKDSAQTSDIIENAQENNSHVSAGNSDNAQAMDEKDQILEAVEDKLPAKDKYSGKYTIQLSSHRSIKEAEEFANGFKIRGYNPIINEVKHKTTGIWYRVSLGVFDTISEAKAYVLKEKSLFDGQDYFFAQFD